MMWCERIRWVTGSCMDASSCTSSTPTCVTPTRWPRSKRVTSGTNASSTNTPSAVRCSATRAKHLTWSSCDSSPKNVLNATKMRENRPSIATSAKSPIATGIRSPPGLAQLLDHLLSQYRHPGPGQSKGAHEHDDAERHLRGVLRSDGADGGSGAPRLED